MQGTFSEGRCYGPDLGTGFFQSLIEFVHCLDLHSQSTRKGVPRSSQVCVDGFLGATEDLVNLRHREFLDVCQGHDLSLTAR